MRIVSVSPFFNEIELLETRVELLFGSVTEHVVIEGDRTHQGADKPMNLWRHSFGDNVRRYTVELPDGEGDAANWQREHIQRNCLATYLQHLNPADLVISTDLDEIPDPEAIPRIIEATAFGPVSLEMRMFYYGLQWENRSRWYHPKAARWGDINGKMTLTELRMGAGSILPNAGWHVSYWGGEARRLAKVEAFAHAENREPEPWERIKAGGEWGPNGERLVPAVIDDLPEILVRRLGAS